MMHLRIDIKMHTLAKSCYKFIYVCGLIAFLCLLRARNSDESFKLPSSVLSIESLRKYSLVRDGKWIWVYETLSSVKYEQKILKIDHKLAGLIIYQSKPVARKQTAPLVVLVGFQSMALLMASGLVSSSSTSDRASPVKHQIDEASFPRVYTQYGRTCVLQASSKLSPRQQDSQISLRSHQGFAFSSKVATLLLCATYTAQCCVSRVYKAHVVNGCPYIKQHFFFLWTQVNLPNDASAMASRCPHALTASLYSFKLQNSPVANVTVGSWAIHVYLKEYPGACGYRIYLHSPWS